MVCSQFPPELGGVANYVYNLSKALLEKGHNITVITRGSTVTREENVSGIRVIRAAFLPIYPVHTSVFGIAVNSLLHQYEQDFDVVHAHCPLSPVLNTKLPVIVTMHTTGIEQERF